MKSFFMLPFILLAAIFLMIYAWFPEPKDFNEPKAI
jgi:hypothetical protein